jgi:hypothetical protein
VVNQITGGTWNITGSTLDVTGSVSGGTISIGAGILDIGGNLSGASTAITLNSSTLDITGAMSRGSVTLNNNSTIMVSTSPSGGTINYGTGTNAVVFTTIGSTNNGVTVTGLNNFDSIAESNIAFNGASLSGSTLTLTENGTTVATFGHVSLANGASTTFEPVTTEVIDNVTYYVATLDPPAGNGATGAGGATGTSGATGATGTGGHTGATGATGTGGHTGATGSSGGDHGHHDKLTAEINPGTLFGPQDHGPRFLYVAGPAAGQPGHTPGAQGTDLLIKAGTDFVKNFNLAQDKLDLTKILAGVPTHELANLANFVKVLGSGPNDQGFGHGTRTTIEISGPHGSATVNLEGAGKLDLQDLLKHHSLILPPH